MRNLCFGTSTSWSVPTASSAWLTRSPILSSPLKLRYSITTAPSTTPQDVAHPADDDHAQDDHRDVEEEARSGRLRR